MRGSGHLRDRVGFVATAVALTVAAGICIAQKPAQATGLQNSPHQTAGTTPASAGSTSPLDSLNSPFPDNNRQKRNDERQRRIVSDTQKLVALSSQLKAEVSSSGAETMTPEMLKQMDEIEKLARSVKDRMRD